MKLSRLRVEWLYSVGNIKVKVMGIVLALALVLSGAVILQARTSLESQGRDQLQRQAVSLANFMAARGTDLVLTNNLYALRELLQDTMAHNPDLRYIVIYDTDGRVVDSTFGREFPAALLTVPTKGTPDPRLLKAASERIYDMAVPMFDGRAGTARVGVTDRRLTESIWTAIRRMLVETAAITAGALLAAYALTVLLTRPLEDLVAATRAVGAGNLSRRPRVFGTDEIGHLSASFNSMIDSLQRSSEEILKRNRDLTVLNSVAESVSRPLGEGDAVPAIMAAVQATLGLERVCIFRTGQTTSNEPWYCSTSGMPPACFAGPEVRNSVAQLGEPQLAGDGGIVPLVAEGRVAGVMCFHGAGAGAVSALETGVLAALGRQIGIALENVRLLEELKAKEAVRADLVNQLISAQEAERKRIALELHDQTGQLMTSMMVGLKLLEGAHSPETARERIADLRSLASTVLEEVHSLALELRPPVLDDLGLVHALDRYTRDFSRKYGVQVDLQADGFLGRRLPAYVGTTLYRISQEALTNAARHSGARLVTLSYSWHRDRITAVIHDDGRGFDPTEVEGRQNQRLGLFSMRERAKMAGGRLEIRSAPGAGTGTTILIQLPAQEVTATPTGGAL